MAMGEPVRSIVLVGFSGAGKSTVGRLLAAKLAWPLVDLDEEIERHYGMTISEVFATHGEAHFRATERRVLLDALARPQAVIATGGGAIAAEDAWSPEVLGGEGVLVVSLDVRPETTLARLTAQQAAEGTRTERPMLAGDDPLSRIRALKAARQAMYDRAHVTLNTDATRPELIAAEIAYLSTVGAGGASGITLKTPSGESRIWIGPGAVNPLGVFLKDRYPKARRAWIVSDERVGALHGERLIEQIGRHKISADLKMVPVGEGSKSLGTAGGLYDWLLRGGVERNDVVVALGGGVIGDLAGFVAATVLRGVGLVQVPTSLLAMVDSSVGGKTGINHAAGKNLIGAFHQPPLVVIDPQFLGTLPPRELTSGWAEIVKHAVIQPSTPHGERADLWDFLDRNAENLKCLREPATTYLIQRNVQLKAWVVEADEREANLRQILNFGHTLGHAIEAAEYRYLHGEAIAVGMRATARIGVEMGTCDVALVERLDATLDRFGLPAKVRADLDQVLALTKSDKKRGAGKQRWILPLSEGGVVIRDDVPEAVVRAALAAVLE